MPMYTYECPLCGHEQDEFRHIQDRDKAPHCDMMCDGESQDERVGMIRKVSAPMITPDISAYQAVAVDVATGKPPVISSRSAHRDFLKRNGYVEVGNEPVGRKPGEVRGDFNVRGDLTQATREALGKRS